MKKLYSSKEPFIIQQIKETLEVRGFGVLVKNEGLAGGCGELPCFEIWPEVWVMDDRDYPRAMELVQELLDAQPEHPDWYCSSCGELNGGAFEVCWSCNAEKKD